MLFLIEHPTKHFISIYVSLNMLYIFLSLQFICNTRNYISGFFLKASQMKNTYKTINDKLSEALYLRQWSDVHSKY